MSPHILIAHSHVTLSVAKEQQEFTEESLALINSIFFLLLFAG